MGDIAAILEHELEEAVEIKDKKSLHRYIRLLVNSMVDKQNFSQTLITMQSDVKLIAERMEQGFRRMDDRFEDLIHQMDKRFEQVDKRFEDFQHRFTMMFSFITIGFTILSVLIVLFKFL